MADLIISGAIAGVLGGQGLPKAIELTALNDIPDLSVYGLGYTPGFSSGSLDLVQYTFPTGSLNAGQKIYVSLEVDTFESFFGFSPTYSFVDSTDIIFLFASITGNDAIELFENGAVVDVFGDVGSSESPSDAEADGWDYSNGWVSRVGGEDDGTTFQVASWNVNKDALNGVDNNASAADSFPVPAVYIVESENSTEISEGAGADTYEVVLNTQPDETVVVTVTPDAQTDVGNGAGQPLLLTFTPTNYDQPQSVTVVAVDDDDPDNNADRVIIHSVSSNDSNYDSIQNDAIIVNFDNLAASNTVVPETVSGAGVTITESNASTEVSESGSVTDTYEITLNSIPTDIVTVTVTADGQTQVDGGMGAGTSVDLTFDPNDPNFSQTQTVTVVAVNDGTEEGDHQSVITHSISSDNDLNYDGLTLPSLTATVFETGVTIIGLPDEPIPEGDSVTYDVVLNSQPSDTVTVTIDPGSQTDLGEGAGIPISLTFESTDVVLSQTVTVTAVDDTRVEGDHTSTITHETQSNDSDYDELSIDDVIINISDAEISITDVTEDSVPEGSTTTYSITLSTTPTDPVTVTITPDAQTDVGNGAGMSVDVMIDPNVSLTEVVTVMVINDTDDEGTHQSIISHTSSSADSSYDDLTIDSVTINITDPGISIVETGGGTTVSEAGVADQYEIVLNSVPSDTLTVTVAPDAQTDVGSGPGIPRDFQFGPTVLSQTVTVNADADGVTEGTHSSTISHSVSASNASEYPLESLSAVNATIIDCFLTGTQLLTDEGEKRVEELKIGDRLQTLDGSLEKIKWIGIQTCYTNGHNHPLRTYPIRVKAGALGPNCPIRDLYVSPDHALLVEGILVNAGALENGDTIVQIQPTDEKFVYYHIELERHSILIAEGAPAESYLPQKQDRNTFDNGNEYAALYPHSNMQALVPMRYPRVSSKRQLPRFIAKYIAQHAKLNPLASRL